MINYEIEFPVLERKCHELRRTILNLEKHIEVLENDNQELANAIEETDRLNSERIEELEQALEDISRAVKPNAYTDERLISRYLEKRIRGIVERSRQADE